MLSDGGACATEDYTHVARTYVHLVLDVLNFQAPEVAERHHLTLLLREPVDYLQGEGQLVLFVDRSGGDGYLRGRLERG